MLVSVDAKTVTESEKFSDVILSLEIVGEELANQTATFRRIVQVDGDPSDLAALFSYSVTEQWVPEETRTLKRPTTVALSPPWV